MKGVQLGYRPASTTVNNPRSTGALLTDVNNKRFNTGNYTATNIRYFPNNTDKSYIVYVSPTGKYMYRDDEHNNNMIGITGKADIDNIKQAIAASALPDNMFGPVRPMEVASIRLQNKLGLNASYNANTTVKELEQISKQNKVKKQQSTKPTSNVQKEPNITSIIANAVAQATAPMKQYIKELESKLPEKLTADKAAEYYGINVNYDDILRDYNAKTNDYFDNASELMRLYRDQMQEDNTNYNASALRSYLNSYRNAAPTASRKGATAASALLSMLGNSADLAQADSASGQNIINQEAQRRAELANNPYLAKEYENNLRTYLSTLSTGIHQADVAKHVGELNSYATRYAGERSGLASAAMGTAYQYQGLANAYGTQAQANALNTTQKMYQFYLDRLGEKYAPAATASALKAQTTAAKK